MLSSQVENEGLIIVHGQTKQHFNLTTCWEILNGYCDKSQKKKIILFNQNDVELVGRENNKHHNKFLKISLTNRKHAVRLSLLLIQVENEGLYFVYDQTKQHLTTCWEILNWYCDQSQK